MRKTKTWSFRRKNKAWPIGSGSDPATLVRRPGRFLHQRWADPIISPRSSHARDELQVYPEGSRDFPSWSCTCMAIWKGGNGTACSRCLVPSQSDRGGGPWSSSPRDPGHCSRHASRSRTSSQGHGSRCIRQGPRFWGEESSRPHGGPHAAGPLLCPLHMRKLRHRGYAICPRSCSHGKTEL